MTKTAIRNVISGRCGVGIVTTQGLADVLNLSVRTVTNAKNRGELKQIDRNTFELDDIVEWLYRRPRYLAYIQPTGEK